jgi:hypothetical protein
MAATSGNANVHALTAGQRALAGKRRGSGRGGRGRGKALAVMFDVDARLCVRTMAAAFIRPPRYD